MDCVTVVAHKVLFITCTKSVKEYQAISAKIDALYGQQLELSADYETTGMAKPRRETHVRMLGNGLCTRPVNSTAAWKSRSTYSQRHLRILYYLDTHSHRI